jgi:hypothetical protein
MDVASLLRHSVGAMWTEDNRRRLDELRREEAQRALSEPEHAELTALFAALDAEEARDLAPALARLSQETEDLRVEKERAEARARELGRTVGGR